MAGVGFELKKLFREQGLLSLVKAYAFSSITTVGPMILCVLMMLTMQWMMQISDTPFLQRELFLATTVYCFIFSVLLTGGLSMLLNRFLADMLFLKKYEHLLSSLYGAIAVALPVGSIGAWLFLRDLPASFGYKVTAYIFFSELTILWVQSVYLSALKDYTRIVRGFFIGVSIALIGAWFMIQYTDMEEVTAALAMIDLGFFVVLLLSARYFETVFPSRDSRISFQFLSYFKKYPALFFIGTFFYSGVYIHSFVYWMGSEGIRVADKFAISPFYDTPVFYAYLTVIPTLVTFVVSVETSFYEKYRDYYSLINNGGTWIDIATARKAMQRSLVHEVSYMMEVQLLFTVLSIALGFKLLPILGFSMQQLDTFTILVLGYYLFIIAFVLMLIMLYFDDRKGVLAISGLFVLLNAAFSYWTMEIGFHGLGMFIASFLVLVASLTRLFIYINKIDYYTFCNQPIAMKPRKPLWERWKIWKYGKRTATLTLTLLISTSLMLTGCTADSASEAPSAGQDTVKADSIVVQTPANGLVEDKRLYERDDDSSVIPLYITIFPDQPEQGKPLTWYELNRISSRMEEGNLKALVQEGGSDGSGPASGSFGYGTTEANAKISLRGNTARYASQRSYKIRLNNQAGLWRDQRVLNLNKHPYDPSRLRNKLSFDIMETLPNMASLRTQFVHLYVKDLSSGGGNNAPYEDYGLYTHIENPNEMFLKNHWLDPNGQLYKAIMFEFFTYPESIKLASDPEYSKVKFEERLEIQGSDDHSKLIAMLNDVNNMAMPIEEVFEKHFDLDNYLTWLAVNILMDNMDTDAQNYILYSPLNSDKWYFLPWDYDGGWELQRGLRSISDYASGISNYWGNKLHNRFFRKTEHVELLKNKIDELYTVINNQAVENRLTTLYRPVVEPFLNKTPDLNFLTIRKDQLQQEYEKIAGVPFRSIQRFNEDLEKPKPFYLDDLNLEQQGAVQFTWDPSFDLQGDDLTYQWVLAYDPAFTRIVKQAELKETRMTISDLPKGTYYWKVIAKDSKQNTQISFDMFEDTEGTPYYGVREVRVE
ncbi:exopolysaccharide Pel transporter PelG [Paenibacillus turpanensis]|uniref:exopolysaccharide Pel transporter PelG n=1 Tax=Paenibacillus turpanensis TaxID=2689078 RepID=UPI00140B5B4C|nr:exopolysaccharide Pel transporter PelG [Paenibacillus turpanensis]